MSRAIPIYLPNTMDDDSPIAQTARRYANGETGGLLPKLEHWRGAEYLVLRYSDAGRILFRPVSINGKCVLLYHGSTPTHDYERCVRTQRFSAVLSEPPRNYRLLQPEITAPDTAQTKLIQWHQQLQMTSSEQSRAVDMLIDQRVTILSGPPGAGKSLAVFGALQEIVKRDESASILFICETPGLAQYFQHAFRAWYCAPKNEKNRVRVIFSSYQKAIPALLLSQANYDCVIAEPKKDIFTYFDNKNIIKELQESFFEEWLLNSSVLHQDFLAQKSFLESDFKKVGERQHIVASDALESVYTLYIHYLKRNQKNINILLQPIPSELKYTHVFVDEAHVYSMVQLQTLFSLGNKSTFVIDPHQSDAPISTLDTFIHGLQYHEKIEASVLRLPVVYRTPESVTVFLNRILRLKNEMHHGVLSKHGYSELTACNEAQKDIFWLDREDLAQTEQLKAYGKSIKFAVILFDECDRAFAKARYDVDAFQIYTIEQIRGREFEQVVLINPFSADIVKEIGVDASKIDLTLDSPERRPAHKTVSFDQSKKSHYLNRLLIAGSRTIDTLMIDEDKETLQNRARLFVDYLRQAQIVPQPVVLTAHEDTQEEIIALANDLFESGDAARARELLQTRLQFAPLEIDTLLASVPELQLPPAAVAVSMPKHVSEMNKKEMEAHFFNPQFDDVCLLQALQYAALKKQSQFCLSEISDHPNAASLFCQLMLEKAFSKNGLKEQINLGLFFVIELIISNDEKTRKNFISTFEQFCQTNIFKENTEVLFNKTFPFKKERQCLFGLLLFFADEAFFKTLWSIYKNVRKSLDESGYSYSFLLTHPNALNKDTILDDLVKTPRGVAFFKEVFVFSNALKEVLQEYFFPRIVAYAFLERIKKHDTKFCDYLVSFFASKSPAAFGNLVANYFRFYIHREDRTDETSRANRYLDLLVKHNKENPEKEIYLCLNYEVSYLLRRRKSSEWGFLLSTTHLLDYIKEGVIPRSVNFDSIEVVGRCHCLWTCIQALSAKQALLPEGQDKALVIEKLAEYEKKLYYVDASGLTDEDVLMALYNHHPKKVLQRMPGLFRTPASLTEAKAREWLSQLSFRQLSGCTEIGSVYGTCIDVDMADLSCLNCRNYDQHTQSPGLGRIAIERMKKQKALNLQNESSINVQKPK